MVIRSNATATTRKRPAAAGVAVAAGAAVAAGVHAWGR